MSAPCAEEDIPSHLALPTLSLPCGRRLPCRPPTSSPPCGARSLAPRLFVALPPPPSLLHTHTYAHASYGRARRDTAGDRKKKRERLRLGESCWRRESVHEYLVLLMWLIRMPRESLFIVHIATRLNAPRSSRQSCAGREAPGPPCDKGDPPGSRRRFGPRRGAGKTPAKHCSSSRRRGHDTVCRRPEVLSCCRAVVHSCTSRNEYLQ